MITYTNNNSLSLSLSLTYTRTLTYLSYPLRERCTEEEVLILAGADLCPHKASRVKDPLRLLPQVDPAHRRHVINVIIRRAAGRIGTAVGVGLGGRKGMCNLIGGHAY